MRTTRQRDVAPTALEPQLAQPSPWTRRGESCASAGSWAAMEVLGERRGYSSMNSQTYGLTGLQKTAVPKSLTLCIYGDSPTSRGVELIIWA